MSSERDNAEEDRDLDAEELKDEELDEVQGGTRLQQQRAKETASGLLAHELTHIQKKDREGDR